LNLNKNEKIMFIRLCGMRYDIGNETLKLTCEMFPNRIENETFLKHQLEIILQTARFLAKKIYSTDNAETEKLLKEYAGMNPYKWENGAPVVETATDFITPIKTLVDSGKPSKAKAAKDNKTKGSPAAAAAPGKDQKKGGAAPGKDQKAAAGGKDQKKDAPAKKDAPKDAKKEAAPAKK
jgi:hypothetical protein